MTIPFVNPSTGRPLLEERSLLIDADTQRVLAPIVNSIPRFVDSHYADSFSWQWHQWENVLSDSRSTGVTKRNLILNRTHFGDYDTHDKSILECGMGGGDDTEVLLQFPFAEVHSFDLSESVDRAGKYLQDSRLILSQASIFAIPYPDESFDFVFCHRVLQHTPDPVRALRAICKKVKPGGVLFAHCYKRSCTYLMNYKYKYRWLTKRLSPENVYYFIDRYGHRLHAVNEICRRSNKLLQALAYSLVPFEWIAGYGDLDRGRLIELGKLVTFDALTPAYDRPVTAPTFRRVIEEEGFRIEHFHNPRVSPLYCTAVKRTDA